MKVLFVIDSLGIGGKEKRCLQVADYINSLENHEVILVTFDDIFDSVNSKINRFQLIRLNRRSSKDIIPAYKLLKLINSFKPDTIISWSLMSSFWLNIFHAFLRFRYITAYVANCSKPKRFSIGNIARLGSFLSADAIVGNSLVGLQNYKVPKKKAHLIYNGYDFEKLASVRNHNLKSLLDIQTPFIVSMIARISAAKDYQTFIEVAKALISKRGDITFLAIGGGPLLQFYKTQLNEFESRFIIFIGERKDIESFYDITDVSVLCSPSEGISNFVLESMANSIPVVATRTGGTPEIISHEFNGFLVDHKNKNDYIYFIEKLIDDESLRKTVGFNAYKSVKEKFDLNLMGSQFSKLINKLPVENINNSL